MKIDILFWFYKEFDICRNKLKKIRSRNEDIRIFALYGGPLSETDMARKAIKKYVDDFYVFEREKKPSWKWEHGDQLITTWYVEKGQHLQWEMLFIMQWDMLISAPLSELFSKLQPGQILLSGFRPANEVASWWPWISPDDPNLKAFKVILHDEFQYDGELFVCLFIVACFPRTFFEKFLEVGMPEAGFIEYKFPTIANIFRIPVCQNHDFHPWWAANPATKNAPLQERVLNAIGQEIPRSIVLRELSKANGRRLFHPVSRHYPMWMENRYVARALYYLDRVFNKISCRLN